MDKTFLSQNNLIMLANIIDKNISENYSYNINSLDEDSISEINNIIKTDMNRIVSNNTKLHNSRNPKVLENFNKKTLEIVIPKIHNILNKKSQNNNYNYLNKIVNNDLIKNTNQSNIQLPSQQPIQSYNDTINESPIQISNQSFNTTNELSSDDLLPINKMNSTYNQLLPINSDYSNNPSEFEQTIINDNSNMLEDQFQFEHFDVKDDNENKPNINLNYDNLIKNRDTFDKIHNDELEKKNNKKVIQNEVIQNEVKQNEVTLNKDIKNKQIENTNIEKLTNNTILNEKVNSNNLLSNENILENNIENDYSKFLIERNKLNDLKLKKGDEIEKIKDEPNDKDFNNKYENLVKDRNNDKKYKSNELIIYSMNREWLKDSLYSFTKILNLSLLKSIELDYIIIPKRDYQELNKIIYDDIFKYPYLLLKIDNLENNIILDNEKVYSKLVKKKEEENYIFYQNENKYISEINSINNIKLELLKPNGDLINVNDKICVNKFSIKNNKLKIKINDNNFLLWDKIKIVCNDKLNKKLKELLEDKEHIITKIENDIIEIDINYMDKDYNSKLEILNINLQISYHFKLNFLD